MSVVSIVTSTSVAATTLKMQLRLIAFLVGFHYHGQQQCYRGLRIGTNKILVKKSGEKNQKALGTFEVKQYT